MRPVKVRCPGCDATVCAQPRIVRVEKQPRSLLVTVEVNPVPHVCGKDSTHPVGFRPATQEVPKHEP